MKGLFLLGAVMFSVSALAEGQKEYSREAVELVNVVSKCSIELKKLLKENSYRSVASVTKLEVEDLTRYEVLVEARYPAPSFRREKIGTLVIDRTFVKSNNTAADAPGGHLQYTCTVELAGR